MFASFAVERGSSINKKTAPIRITSSNTGSVRLKESKSQPTSDSTESPSLNIHDGSNTCCCSLGWVAASRRSTSSTTMEVALLLLRVAELLAVAVVFQTTIPPSTVDGVV
jgi:hypothetical protein